MLKTKKSAIASVALGFIATSVAFVTPNAAQAQTTETTTMASPIKSYPTLGDAEKATKITCPVPPQARVPAGYAYKSVHTVSDKVIDVRYTSGDNVASLRCTKGDKGAISGVYGSFDDKVVTVGGLGDVTLKKTAAGVTFALWSYGTQSYSISFDKPVNEDVVLDWLRALPVLQ